MSYAIYVRLTRDIPRRPSGLIAARFDVNGASDGDPIGRQSKPRYCFTQTVVPRFASSHYPSNPGSRVRVTLTSFDRLGEPDGELSTIVRLRPPEPPRAANDYSPPIEQEAVGC